MSNDKMNVSSESSCSAASTPYHPVTAVPFEALSLAEVEKRHILAVLEHCKGNRTHAARLLQVSIRTLRNKLHEYNRAVELGKNGNPIEMDQGHPKG